MKKLRQKIAGFLNNSHHAHTIGLVGLLTIIIAIPLTVYILQQQQDVRQRAVGGGFSLVSTNGCGETITTPQDGENEGDISWRAPVRENGQWVTKKQDGSTIAQATMRERFITDVRNGSDEAAKATEWDTKVVSDIHINCNVFIVYHGIDCDRTPVSGFVDKIDSEGQPYKAVPAGRLALLHVIAGTNPQSPNCRYNFHVRDDIGSALTPTPGIPTPSGTVSPTIAVGVTPSDTPRVTNVQATALACTTDNKSPIKITWTNPTGAVWHKIERSTDGTAWSLLSYTDGSKPLVAEYTDTTPEGGRFYAYRVFVAVSGSSDLSNPTVQANATWPAAAVCTPTGTPTPTATPQATPTPTNVPTPTIPSTPTLFSVALSLPGIGKDGNEAPNNMQRRVFISLFDSANKALGASVSSVISFDLGSGIFKGTANFGTIVPTGKYAVKLKMDQYLVKTLASGSAVTAGMTNTIPQARLISGDINSDNKLDILDYNILAGCFGNKINSDTCGDKKVDADLNDDGVIDGVDYNLFIGGLKTAKQGE